MGPGDEYIVFHDLYVPNEEYGVMQIDQLVVSLHRSFVIETKHYSGWIFGMKSRNAGRRSSIRKSSACMIRSDKTMSLSRKSKHICMKHACRSIPSSPFQTAPN
ncbi:nuclease-related domain-containing protein [Sporosarcina obsidiansis]|uniref:nuclease-related domain-containing protein n=1 Tax=Sporosarcina obsidiansis TaxID=2660748 RepID=UPI0018917339